MNGVFLGVTNLETDVEIGVKTVQSQASDVHDSIENRSNEIKGKSALYLLDSGSQTHALCDESIQFENEVEVNNRITGFNGSTVLIKNKGDVTLKDISTGSMVTLIGARKSSFIKKNIISAGQLQKEGWILRGDDGLIVLEKGEDLLRFTKTKEQNLYYMRGSAVQRGQNSHQTIAYNVIDDFEVEDGGEIVFAVSNDDPGPPELVEHWDSDSSDDESIPFLYERNDLDSSSANEWSDEDSNGERIVHLHPATQSKSWINNDSNDEDETWTPVGKDFPRYGGRSVTKTQSWGRVYTTDEGQPAMVMNTMTEDKPTDYNTKGAAIVSDSEPLWSFFAVLFHLMM